MQNTVEILYEYSIQKVSIGIDTRFGIRSQAGYRTVGRYRNGVSSAGRSAPPGTCHAITRSLAAEDPDAG